MKRRRFFGPEEGWSLEPVAAWLLSEGRRIQNAVALANELAAQMDAIHSLFPQMQW